MKKYTNKETSRLRLHRRVKSTISILAAIMAIGAVSVAMNTSFKSTAPSGNEEVLEVSTCTVDVKAAQTTTTATTMTTMTTTSLQTSTVVSTSTSTSTAILSTDYLQTETQTHTSITTAVMTTTTEATTLTTTMPVTMTAIVTTEVVPVAATPVRPISDAEYVWLCNLVGHEYGSNWVPVAEKAKVVAVVMNRVNSPKFPNNIWSVLTAPYQFTGFSSYGTGGYTRQVTQSVKDAVDYYFSHQDEFPNWLYFDGNHYLSDGSGPYNFFYF